MYLLASAGEVTPTGRPRQSRRTCGGATAAAAAMFDLCEAYGFFGLRAYRDAFGRFGRNRNGLLFTPPAIKNPGPRPEAGPWRGKDITLAAALSLYLQIAGAAMFNWLWFMGMEPTADLDNAFTIAVSITTQAAAVICVRT